MKGIFHPDKHYDWEDPSPSRQEMQELIKMDPVEDKYYLDYIITHVQDGRRPYLMRRLGISKLPEKMYRDFGWSSEDYERYRVLCEQVAREPDAEGKATITESGGTEGGAEGRAAVTEEGIAEPGTAVSAEGRTTSYRAFVALMNLSRLRLKYLDRLDLMMLMTDSDFLIDVCRACNAGDETPHVFPANGTAFARLAEREPGYAAVFEQISEGSCVN